MSGERHGNAVVGPAVLGEDPVRFGDGAVEPQAGAGPDVLARPFPAAVGYRPAGECLDPAVGLTVLEQLRDGRKVHTLPGAYRRGGVVSAHGDAPGIADA